MLSEELLRKIKRIELITRKRVDEMLSGQYKSHFRGHGVQFSEHRVYSPGDDIRHIDWKASARMREALVKKYEEERELNVFLVVDISASESFGTSVSFKSEVAAEVAAMLAYAAVQTGDRVGMLMFSGEIEKIIPPRKGRSHVLRLVRDLLVYVPRSRGTDLASALQAAGRIMKHSGVVIIISDFRADSYDREIKRLGSKHDVVAIQIEDPRERSIPEMGTCLFVEPESGQEVVVDTHSYGFQQWIKKYVQEWDAKVAQNLKSAQVETLKVSTAEDHAAAVVAFFRTRARKRGRK